MLSDAWPFFDIRIRTPRLEMRCPTDDDCARLIELVKEPVHDDDFMPFLVPWTRPPSPERERNSLQHWWRQRANLTADDWTLSFMVIADGEPAGVQDITGRRFSIARSVKTGSWLVQRRHGEGIGKEMRAAVLHLAFAHLGALEAQTSAFEDNAPSLGVTRSLGYEPNGSYIDVREGKAVRHLNFSMTRAQWDARRRDDITVENVDRCLPLLGAGKGT